MSNKVEILGVAVDSITMNEAVAQVENYMDERAGVLIATANAEMIMRATHDEELFHILNAAALVVPDGAGTVWAARHLGYAMPERVAGYDMAQELMKRAPMNHRRIFFFGSARELRTRPGQRLRNCIRASRLSGRAMVSLRKRMSRRLSRKSGQRSRTCFWLHLVCQNRRNGSISIRQSLVFRWLSGLAVRWMSWLVS